MDEWLCAVSSAFPAHSCSHGEHSVVSLSLKGGLMRYSEDDAEFQKCVQLLLRVVISDPCQPQEKDISFSYS